MTLPPQGEVLVEHLADHQVHVTMNGDVDLSCFTDAHRAALDTTRTGDTVRIDASGCTFLDSVGLAFLLSMRNAAGRAPTVALRPSLRTLFRMSGVEALFRLELVASV